MSKRKDRSIQCPRCRGKGTRNQRVTILYDLGGASSTEMVDCLTCNGEGRLGSVVTLPRDKCYCCGRPDKDHVCVTRGPIDMPLRESWCETHRQYFV